MFLVCAIIDAATCLRTHPIPGTSHNYYWHGNELAPEPHEVYYPVLEHCISVLRDKCLKQMSDYKSCERTDLCKECSDQFIQMGNVCNKKLSNTPSQPDRKGVKDSAKKSSKFERLLSLARLLITLEKRRQ